MVTTFFEALYTLVAFSLLYFFLCHSVNQKEDLRKKLLWWALFGVSFNFYTFSFLYTTYPLLWMPEGPSQLFAIFLLHIIMATVSGVSFFLVGFSFSKKIPDRFRLISFALLLMFAEIVRSFLLSFMFLSKEIPLGLHFTIGSIGNALSITPLVEFAYLTGSFGLSFIFGYVVFLIYSIVSKKENKGALLYHALGITVLFMMFHYVLPTHGPKNFFSVGVVTTDFKTPKDSEIDQSFKDNAEKLHTQIMELKQFSPSVIVLPEDSRYLSNINNSNFEDYNKAFPKTLLVDGDTLNKNGGLSNISLLYTPQEKKVFAVGKYFLVPFNEYIPYAFDPLVRFFVRKENIDTYVKNHTYKSVTSGRVLPFEGEKVGTLICSEVLSFSSIDNLRSERPSLVFFQSRLNVFHNNPWFLAHIQSLSKIAAAQMRTPIVSSSNNALSHVISSRGKIVKTTEVGFYSVGVEVGK